MKLTPGRLFAGLVVLSVALVNPPLGMVVGLVAGLLLLAARGTSPQGDRAGLAARDAAWRAVESRHLAWIVNELNALGAQGMLGEEGHRLLAWFHTRADFLAAAARPSVPWAPPAVGAWTPPSPAPVWHGAPAGTPPAPPPPPAGHPRRAFDMREFLTDHAILLLSYAGAALLVTSTLLFILLGPDGVGGGWRAAAVGGLNAVLAGIAVASRRRELTRVISGPYTAMAAASLPLTLTAIYTYVLAGPTGMSVPTALALGGVLCAAAHAPLAVALRSSAYGATALGAAVVALCAAAVATDLGFVWLPGAGAVAVGGWWLAGRPPTSRLRPFATAGHLLAVVMTTDAPVMGAIAAAAHATPGWLAGGHAVYVPATLAAVGASTVACRFAGLGRRGWVWLGAAFEALVPWTAAATLGGDATAQSYALTASGLALGAVAAVAASRARRLPVMLEPVDGLAAAAAAFLLAGVAVAPSFVPAIAAISLGTAVGAAVAVRGRGDHDGAWAFLGVLIAAAGTVAAITPPPGSTAGPVESWPVLAPVGLAVGLCGVLVAAVKRRSAPMLASLVLGITGVSLTAVSAWHAGHEGYPIALIAQSAVQTLLVARLSGRLRELAAAGVAARLAVAGAIVVSSLELQLGLSLAIASVSVALAAVAARRPGPPWALGAFAAAAAGYAWYWATAETLGSAIVPAASFAVSTAVLGAVLAGAAAGLHIARWRVARELAAGVAAVAAAAYATGAIAALADADWTISAILLGALAVVSWAAGARPGSSSAGATAAAVALAVAAALAATTATSLDAPGRTLCVAGVALAVRLATALERGARVERRATARWSALGAALFGVGVALSAAGTVSPHSAIPVDPAALAAAGGVASLVAIAILAVDGTLLERCLALAGAGLALDWLSLGLQETDIQAYVVAPAVALITAGLILRSTRAHGDEAAAALLTGLCVLLGSS
ncbi:MAG TPA: hypothetical protein VFO60_08210, partial [Candidatus Dormibacteraeota bacterium]|nr:hypothetical protein [Candidatus Dormibacteraeota bacterium]